MDRHKEPENPTQGNPPGYLAHARPLRDPCAWGGIRGRTGAYAPHSSGEDKNAYKKLIAIPAIVLAGGLGLAACGSISPSSSAPASGLSLSCLITGTGEVVNVGPALHANVSNPGGSPVSVSSITVHESTGNVVTISTAQAEADSYVTFPGSYDELGTGVTTVPAHGDLAWVVGPAPGATTCQVQSVVTGS